MDDCAGTEQYLFPEILDLTLCSEDEEENKSIESSGNFNQSTNRRTRKSKTLPYKREFEYTKEALDSSREENNSKYKKDSKKLMKLSAPPGSQVADTSENDKTHQRTGYSETDLVLSRSKKEKIRRAVKKETLQNLLSSKAKGRDQGDKSSDTAKPRSRGMTSIKDPDESDDFSGGTTPYRAVVYKNQEKMEKIKKLNKINKKNLKRKKTKSSDEPVSSTQVSDCDSVHLKSEILETNGGKPEDTCKENSGDQKKCVTCQELIKTSEFSDHRRDCLSKKFTRGSGNLTAVQRAVGLHYCQICQQDITDLNTEDRSCHVNFCIDQASSRSENEALSARDDGSGMTCHVCKKDLSRFNSQRKMQHINRCIDQVEEAEKQQRDNQAALEKARNKILNCPLCGQHLKTANGRRTHLKKCATKYSVSPLVLQERIKQQEEEYTQKLESGVIPLQPELKKKKRNHIKSASSTTRPEEPISKVDADMQLAVALSKSIRQQESQVTTNNEKTDEHKNAASNAFSILMTPKLQKHTKRKPKQKSTSTLMVANEQDVARRLSERVGKLLLPQEDDKITCTPKFPQSNVWSGKMSSLWEKGVHVSFDKIQYYVKDLMPPLSISTVECGSKLRRLSSIPGRDVSIYEATPSKSEHNKNRIDLNNTTMIATTQTALLLAEMDGDLKEKNCDTEKDFNKTINEPDLNATGFILPEDNEAGSSETITASYERLIKEQEKMINNSFLSDISLETRDGVVYAHKYALVVRCPTLLKSIEKVSKVDLQDFSKDAVLALLRYLYIDDMAPKNIVAEEVEKLASRFGLVELVNVCKDIAVKSDVAEESEEFHQTQSSAPDLDALLKKVWGSDESSSDEESGERKDDDLEREEAEIEAVYEFMASQKSDSPKIEASSSEEDSNESSGDANDLACESQSRMKEFKCPNKTRLLQEEILKELLSPEIEESKEISAVNENGGDKEDMKLYMEESDGSDTGDNNFGGSPLVRIMKQCKKRRSPEDVDFNIEGSSTGENAFESMKNANDVGDLVSPHDKFTVLLCEKCPLDRRQLNKLDCNNILEKVVMTRSDFNATSKERPEIKLCSITICDKCTPCKEAQSVHVDASDKEVLSRSASRTLNFTTCLQRKKPYETPVGSRTFSVTESVTPDLFDTSTATEEYSMDVSFRSLNKEKTSKYSGSSSRLFSDDDQIAYSDRIAPKDMDGNVVKELDADVRDECDVPVRETENFETVNGCPPNSSEVADSAYEDIDGTDSDGVMVLTQEEIAALPKSRTPSPVFCSQTSQADRYEMGTCTDQSLVKMEKETSEGKDTQSDSCDEEKISEPGWIRQHTPNSHKPKKVYTFKRRNIRSKTVDDQNTEHGDSSTQWSEDVDQRKSRRLSLSQKRKKRKSSSSSISSSSSSNAEKKLRVNRETPDEEESQNNSQSMELHRSLADDEAIDLTQDESPDGNQENVDFVDENQNNQNENEVFNSFDDIPWQDDAEDGVLVMHDPEELSPNVLKEGSSIKVNKKAKHGQRLLDGSFYDPPTDMETDHSVLYDSMTWNEDNEPKELSSSQNMMKTPSAPVPKKAKKPLREWLPPSPFTPMPPYDSMTTPELKQHCKKYGIRALPKKRMKATLKTIHMETHQWETDSEFEDGEREQSPKRSQTSLKTIQKKTKGKNPDSMKDNKTKNRHSHDDCYDAVEANDLDSSSSSLPELLEESMMPETIGIMDEDQGEEITPSQLHASPKTKEQRARARTEKLFAQMKNYVRGNIKVYEKVLQYEVFEFDDFKADFKNAGIKVGNGILVDFLDEMNIQFTWRNHQQGEKEKQGKRSPSKRGRAKRNKGKRNDEVS